MRSTSLLRHDQNMFEPLYPRCGHQFACVYINYKIIEDPRIKSIRWTEHLGAAYWRTCLITLTWNNVSKAATDTKICEVTDCPLSTDAKGTRILIYSDFSGQDRSYQIRNGKIPRLIEVLKSVPTKVFRL